MAEAELTLIYREPLTKLVHGLFMISVPVITLFVLLCSISVWGNYDLANTSLFVFSLFVLLTIVVAGIVITSDKTIFLTRDGISLPFLLNPGFRLRTHHSWKDLASIKHRRSGKHGVLDLRFKHGGATSINLDLLPDKQVENLIVSLDVWCGGADAFPALFEARMRLLENKGDAGLPGYTEIWEDELSRRFGPTNFIPLEPDHMAGKYKVERQLAFGGLSALYIVSDAEAGRFVLKEAVIPTDADEELRLAAENMLNREAEILSSLRHKHIARILDNFLDQGRHYLLMELIEGEDLRRLVKENGAQEEKDVIFWALQLLDALNYLHRLNPPVIHRDLSPDNLMLRENGEICIIDFGAANHFIGTATGTLIGKQAYIAPEQLRGKAEPASDIYAFAGTLFFLLTGQDPEALSVSHPRDLKPGLSKAIDELIALCTEQDAGRRLCDGTEIARRLRELSGVK